MFKKGLDSKFCYFHLYSQLLSVKIFVLYAEVRVSASDKRRFQSMPLTPGENCELLIGDLLKFVFFSMAMKQS